MRAAIYCRMATGSQNNDRAAIYVRSATVEEGPSNTTRQLERAQYYCHQQGLKICGVYRDEGISGLTLLDMRPSGAKLLADACLGMIDHVIAISPDRISRDPTYLASTLHNLSLLGIQVLFIQAAEQAASHEQ